MHPPEFPKVGKQRAPNCRTSCCLFHEPGKIPCPLKLCVCVSRKIKIIPQNFVALECFYCCRWKTGLVIAPGSSWILPPVIPEGCFRSDLKFSRCSCPFPTTSQGKCRLSLSPGTFHLRSIPAQIHFPGFPLEVALGWTRAPAAPGPRCSRRSDQKDSEMRNRNSFSPVFGFS